MNNFYDDEDLMSSWAIVLVSTHDEGSMDIGQRALELEFLVEVAPPICVNFHFLGISVFPSCIDAKYSLQLTEHSALTEKSTTVDFSPCNVKESWHWGLFCLSGLTPAANDQLRLSEQCSITMEALSGHQARGPILTGLLPFFSANQQV